MSDSYEAPRSMSVAIGLTDTDKAERIFAALADGGDVQMDLQETFWAKRFGMLTDRYGVPWMISAGEMGQG
jgi:PhnB protein